MLKSRKESDTYLATDSRHCRSPQIAMKVNKVCSFQPALRPSSAEEEDWPLFNMYFFSIWSIYVMIYVYCQSRGMEGNLQLRKSVIECQYGMLEMSANYRQNFPCFNYVKVMGVWNLILFAELVHYQCSILWWIVMHLHFFHLLYWTSSITVKLSTMPIFHSCFSFMIPD